MKIPATFLYAGLAIGLCSGAGAQMRHDPLNPREADQLRESAPEPKTRIALLVSFARERMMAVDRLRGAASADNSGKIADLLGELAAIIDELDDNLEMYGRRGEDLRRPLHQLLDAEAEILKKLEALNENTTALQKRSLAAALEDASDSVRASSEGARAMLAAQIAKKGAEKDAK